jgi:hypothetical protein
MTVTLDALMRTLAIFCVSWAIGFAIGRAFPRRD